ncbi:MAG TPA: calcium/proton exchanger [Candidatus Limnocylindrales bacterium]|nr:calcium/proton exchanger [Candidatus Limnocylindrales bacterium]
MPIPRFAQTLGRNASVLMAVAVAATLVTFVARQAGANEVLVFVASAVALAGLAGLVGEATDELGSHMGPGATGVLQSALGNLPELFISIFALQAGLVTVVQTALVGSILANSLLVLGLAFLLGGLRNGVQRFEAEPVRMMAILIVLAVGALLIPTLATQPGAPDVGHQVDLSEEVAVVLLVVFAASIPYSIRGGPGASAIGTHVAEGEAWPLALSLAVLALSAAGAAVVSDWFVEALRPAMASLGLSEEFVGLVIVAIAGNAVENVVGVQMALRDRMDLAVSLILNSSLQVAVALTPALVLVSLVLGGPALTLILPPLLLGALGLTAILGAMVVFDGESTWLEGLALVGLYLIIAASVWYGPPVQA